MEVSARASGAAASTGAALGAAAAGAGAAAALGAGAGATLPLPPAKYQYAPAAAARAATAAAISGSFDLPPEPSAPLAGGLAGSGSRKSLGAGAWRIGAASRAATASAMAPSNTARVLRGSSGLGSTAKTLLPLRAAPTCFSAACSANTRVRARGAFAAAMSTAPRTLATARASMTSSCARLPLLRPSSAASMVSTGRIPAWPSSAWPSSSRKSSRVVTAVTSTAGWAPAFPVVGFAVSALREAVDGALAT